MHEPTHPLFLASGPVWQALAVTFLLLLLLHVFIPKIKLSCLLIGPFILILNIFCHFLSKIEIYGKQRELDALKEEVKKLLEEIKASEKEIQKLSHDLEVSSEINSDISIFFHFVLLFDSSGTSGAQV